VVLKRIKSSLPRPISKIDMQPSWKNRAILKIDNKQKETQWQEKMRSRTFRRYGYPRKRTMHWQVKNKICPPCVGPTFCAELTSRSSKISWHATRRWKMSILMSDALDRLSRLPFPDGLPNYLGLLWVAAEFVTATALCIRRSQINDWSQAKWASHLAGELEHGWWKGVASIRSELLASSKQCSAAQGVRMGYYTKLRRDRYWCQNQSILLQFDAIELRRAVGQQGHCDRFLY
jgi:hypothetical protein